MFVSVSKARSCRVLPTAISKMILPRLDHTCAAMLSTYVWMWYKVCILGAKICTCVRRAAISRSLIDTPPLGLVSNTSIYCVSIENGELQLNHWPSRS